ncbi:DUF6880 family protein [Streptomyces sp. NPDC005065]|uniref:DUF6880 family protein n=1 Tax=unclassified Streptomyces TaxID=2593676 RepID=UPI0033BAFBAD
MSTEETSAALSDLVDALRRDKRRGPYAGHDAYVHTAWAVQEQATRLIESRSAVSAVPELRKAVDRITKALMHLDDSSGMAGDALRALVDCYARALAAAPPKNPAPLARWIAATTLDGPGWPDLPLAAFAPALGPKGLAALTDIVEERARFLTPADQYGAEFGVRHLRVQLAEVSGDTDHYIAVLAEQLTSPTPYVKIVRALRAADRPDEAVTWAERGLTDHPTSPNQYAGPLRDELVALHLAADRPEKALLVRRDAFARTPVHDLFRPLAATANSLDHPEAIDWALDLLRERLDTNPTTYTRELIECLRETGRTDDAWHTATTHLDALSKYTLQDLIEKRRTTHPADVIAPYHHLVDLYLADTGNKRRYDYTARHLKKLRTVHRTRLRRLPHHPACRTPP